MIVEPTNKTENSASLTAIQRILYFALPTLIIVGALIAYKSSTAMAVIGKVSVAGSLTPRGNVIPLAALALLIAGPAINLPSLLTIMRSTNWKIAAMVAASIWVIAVVSGLIVNSF